MNYKQLLFIILLLSGIYFIYGLRIKQTFKNNNNTICRGYLSDKEYLEHMIPHHQVAVDISIMLQKKTKNPVMQEILRKLIWTQNYEIHLMKHILSNVPTNFNTSDNNVNTTKKNYISTVSDFIKPNTLGFTDTYCDPHFFNPEEHMKHLSHMKLNDKMYIEHMIPHHQVAVDMSKKLLKHTKNNFMIHLAYRIIRSQQEEIVMLDNYLQTISRMYKSNIIP
jgi:uncharacterized protein (DUF305 family)